MQGRADSKTLHEQNPPVLNWKCRLTQVDLYDGRNIVVVVVVMNLSYDISKCCSDLDE